MLTSLGGRALGASCLPEVWLPGLRDCLEPAHRRALPSPLVTSGSPAVAGLRLAAPTRPACLRWVLWPLWGSHCLSLDTGCVPALGSRLTFPCRAASPRSSLAPGNNPHVPGVRSPDLLLISRAFIWIRNPVILWALQPNPTSGLNSLSIFILPVRTH